MGFTNEGNPTDQDRFGGGGVLGGNDDATRRATVDLERALADERRRSEQLSLALHESEENVQRNDALIVDGDARSALAARLDPAQHPEHPPRAPPACRAGSARACRAREELVRHAAKLISDLLDVRTQPAVTPDASAEEMDLHAFVRDTIDLLEEQIRAAKCTVYIQCEGPIVGRWDKVCLGQIVSNLVDQRDQVRRRQATRDHDRPKLGRRSHRRQRSRHRARRAGPPADLRAVRAAAPDDDPERCRPGPVDRRRGDPPARRIGPPAQRARRGLDVHRRAPRRVSGPGAALPSLAAVLEAAEGRDAGAARSARAQAGGVLTFIAATALGGAGRVAVAVAVAGPRRDQVVARRGAARRSALAAGGESGVQVPREPLRLQP